MKTFARVIVAIVGQKSSGQRSNEIKLVFTHYLPISTLKKVMEPHDM